MLLLLVLRLLLLLAPSPFNGVSDANIQDLVAGEQTCASRLQRKFMLACTRRLLGMPQTIVLLCVIHGLQ